MNFLAHLALSRGDSELLVGNFMGDFVKGSHLDSYAAKVQEGILLHRRIDAFTDAHPSFRKSKAVLFPEYRHYSSVIVDMYYDHFLAANWQSFFEEDLTDFCEESYEILVAHQKIMPQKAQRVLDYMISGNWLVNYSTLEGLERYLTGMSKRTKFDSKLDQAADSLRERYDLFRDEFLEFFPRIREEME